MGTQAKLLYSNLSADGYDATLVDYKFKIHEYSSIYDTLPRIFAFFAAHKRNPDPAVVTYSRLPGEDVPAIGLTYDHAYWVSGLRSADATKRSDTNVESLGISHGALRPAAAIKTDVIGDEGGPTGPPRTLRELFQTTPAYAAPAPTSNGAVLGLTNVSAISLDLGRMRLVDDCTLTLQVTSDQPVTISLGSRQVSAPAGTSTQKATGGACAISGGGGGLPGTGRAPTTAALAGLVLAAVLGLAAAMFYRRMQRT
jgi:hypothetical protein